MCFSFKTSRRTVKKKNQFVVPATPSEDDLILIKVITIEIWLLNLNFTFHIYVNMNFKSFIILSFIKNFMFISYRMKALMFHFVDSFMT